MPVIVLFWREKGRKKSAWEIQGRLQEAGNICFSDINVCEGSIGPRKRGSGGQPRKERSARGKGMLSVRRR